MDDLFVCARTLFFLHGILFLIPACVWVQFMSNGTRDRRVIDSENLQINSWTAGAEEIRSEAQATQSVVRAASEQTVISGL